MGGGGVNMPPASCQRFCCFRRFSPDSAGDGFFSLVSPRKNLSVARPNPPFTGALGESSPVLPPLPPARSPP